MSVEIFLWKPLFRCIVFLSVEDIICLSSINGNFLPNSLFEIMSTYWWCPYFLFGTHLITILDFYAVDYLQVIWFSVICSTSPQVSNKHGLRQDKGFTSSKPFSHWTYKGVYKSNSLYTFHKNIEWRKISKTIINILILL